MRGRGSKARGCRSGGKHDEISSEVESKHGSRIDGRVVGETTPSEECLAGRLCEVLRVRRGVRRAFRLERATSQREKKGEAKGQRGNADGKPGGNDVQGNALQRGDGE